MLKYGTNNVGTMYYGGNMIGAAYYGSNLVYQNGTPVPPPVPTVNYFWSQPVEEDATFTLTIASSVSTAMLTSVSYSVDNGTTWVTTENVASTVVTITTPTIQAGKKVLWKGYGKAYASNNTDGTYSNFTCSADFNVGGDIGYLFYGDEYSGTFSAFTRNYALCSFFQDSSVVDASQLILSALASTTYGQCYRALFYGCSKLTKPPVILLRDATGDTCCYYMFGYCTSLESIAEFDLSTFATGAFEYIYRGCTSLTGADLSGSGWTTIPRYAFYDCSSLVSVNFSPYMTAIADYAFSGADSSSACKLTSLNLSSTSVTRIYERAFRYCPLTSITLPNTLSRLDSYCFQATLITSIQFPSSLTYIGGSVFDSCTGLRGQTIDLSNCTSLTNIGMGGCQASYISLPSSISTLQGDCFRSTWFLEVDLSACTNITEIPLRCFAQTTRLKLIKLPSSITSVQGSNFTTEERGDVVCYATTPPVCASSLNGKTNTDFYVPYSADHSILAAYQADQYWGELTYIYELNPDGTIPSSNQS